MQRWHAQLARVHHGDLAGGSNVSLHALQVQDTRPSPFPPWTSNLAAEPSMPLTTRDLLRKSITLLSASSGSSRLPPLDTGISGQLLKQGLPVGVMQPATLFVEGKLFQPFTDTRASSLCCALCIASLPEQPMTALAAMIVL